MKYILGVLGVIVLTILAVVIIVGRNPNTQDSSTKKTTTPKVTLADYTNKNSWVTTTTYGRVTGEDQRRAIRITVTPTERRLEILKGYENFVETSKSYANTQSAYDTFMRSLDGFGFLKARTSTVTADRKGACPFGNVYEYQLNDGSKLKSDLWGTSCSASEGTFVGNGYSARQLFQAQIPDYNNLTANVAL